MYSAILFFMVIKAKTQSVANFDHGVEIMLPVWHAAQ